MKKNVFERMKEEMVPAPALEAELKYALETKRRWSASAVLVRWGCAVASVLVASVLVFNMTMPAAAEQLPVVGRALESLNTVGREARDMGKTPEFLTQKEERDFDICLDFAHSDGLELKVRIELFDREGRIDEECKIVTLSCALVEFSGEYLYPIAESPRLERGEGGVFFGWATFNSSPVAAMLSDSKPEAATLCCDGIVAFVEGATFEETCSIYTYDQSFCEAFEFDVDLKELSVEYVGLSSEGITLEYIMRAGERTDVVYSVDETVEYARSLSIYTDGVVPTLVTMNSVKDERGRYIYTASFTEREASIIFDSLNGGCEKEEGAAPEVFIYSHATGEYIEFCEEAEEE